MKIESSNIIFSLNNTNIIETSLFIYNGGFQRVYSTFDMADDALSSANMPHYKSDKTPNIGPFYDLHEIDWVYISDYLCGVHLPPLFWLCSSSYNSSWSTIDKLHTIFWAPLIHNLDGDIQRTVVEIIQAGISKKTYVFTQEPMRSILKIY